MAFQKLLAFTKKVADLADQPTLTPTELKTQFDAAPEELRGSFNTLVDDLNTLNPASKTQGSWNNATLQNGWLNSGPSTDSAGYRLEEFGVVRLRGVIKSGLDGYAAFFLPNGMKPLKEKYLSVASHNGSTRVPTNIIVYPDGSVVPSGSGNVVLPLDGLTFEIN